METKQFVKNLLLRTIPFFAVVIATIVLKVAEVMPGDWWGWYVLYVVDVLALAFPVVYGAKNCKGMVIENVKKGYVKKVAKQYLAMWDHPEHNEANIIGFIYQNERNFDRTILFEEDKMTVDQVVRDDDGMVTGENEKYVFTYQQITGMAIVDIGLEGSAHIEMTVDNGNKEYVYFDLDMAKYLMKKCNMQIENMDELKTFYIRLTQDMVI